MASTPAQLTYVGHATVLIETDGTRLLTDPVLRDHVAHLRRYGPPPDFSQLGRLDAVLISHLHLDHLDIPSLALLGRVTRVIVPAGAASLLQRRDFRVVEEISPGESTSVGTLTVTATPASHSGFRPPIGPTASALGFLVDGSRRVYFAGDTNLFPQMADLAADLDVALLPIWGWGRSLGPGHLDPERAAESLTLLRPRVAVPIHWGTFASLAPRRLPPDFLTSPPQTFKELAARVAPDVDVKILLPGGTLGISSL